jgi:hypothetical protein
MSNNHINVKHSRTGKRSDWYAFWPVLAISGVLGLFVALYAVRLYRAGLPQDSDIPIVALANGQNLHLEKSKLNPSQMYLFEANAVGKKVKFIVQQTQDRKIHVALASCRSCVRSRNPHYARNSEMICGQCKEAMAFESKVQKATPNNCALAEIPHTETDRDVTVLSHDVIAEASKLLQ